MSEAVAFEVVVPFLQLTDPKGHRHFLHEGKNLPAWVPADQVRTLVESGAVYKYEVI